MEELEGFLMQEDMDILQELRAPTLTISEDNASLNLDQLWGFEFPATGGFESEFSSLIRLDEFVIPRDMPWSFISTEEENNGPLDQYIQLEQEQEREQEPVVQPLRPLDEEEDEESDDKSRPDSKNLVSERNRRKRLNQQLFTLRSLVPNITKMDKRSILVDALAYLQSITQQIEMEMKMKSLSSDSSASSSNLAFNGALVQEDAQPVLTALYERQCVALPLLSLVEADVLDEERFLLRIFCNKAVGALGQVDRIIEMLGMEITCISMDEFDQDTMETTAFLRVKKKGIVTRTKLLNRVRLNAKQLGLLLPPDE